MLLLASMYDEGNGVLENDKKALVWLKRAAERDNVEAQIKVALWYEKGIGTYKDLHSAQFWLYQASLQGSKGANEKLNESKYRKITNKKLISNRSNYIQLPYVGAFFIAIFISVLLWKFKSLKNVNLTLLMENEKIEELILEMKNSPHVSLGKLDKANSIIRNANKRISELKSEKKSIQNNLNEKCKNIITLKNEIKLFEEQLKNKNTRNNYDMNDFETLGILNSATMNEIRKNYKKLSLIYHPDKCGVNGNNMMKNINLSYKRLTSNK